MIVWTDLETTGLDPTKEQILEVAVIITDDQLNEVARFERVVYYEHADTIIAHCATVDVEREKRIKTLDAPPALTPEQKTFGLQQIEDWYNYTKADSSWQVTGVAVNPFVIKMHWENGLWKACRRGENIKTVDTDLRDFIKEHGVKITTDGKQSGGVPKTFVSKPQLAGSTISFDREFMRHGFPLTMAEGKNGVLHHRNLDVSTMNELARRFWAEVHEARPGRDTNAKHRGMDDIQSSIDVLKHYIASLGPTKNNQIVALEREITTLRKKLPLSPGVY